MSLSASERVVEYKYFKDSILYYIKPCCGPRMIYSGPDSATNFYRVLDPDPDADPYPDPKLFKQIWGKKLFKHLKFIHKEEFTNYFICHFLFHAKVLQYIQSRIYRPKIRN